MKLTQVIIVALGLTLTGGLVSCAKKEEPPAPASAVEEAAGAAVEAAGEAAEAAGEAAEDAAEEVKKAAE